MREDVLSGVDDVAPPTMHDGGGVVHGSAKQIAEALVAQAHPQDRHRTLQDGIPADTEILGSLRAARAWRDHDVVEGSVADLLL